MGSADSDLTEGTAGPGGSHGRASCPKHFIAHSRAGRPRNNSDNTLICDPGRPWRRLPFRVHLLTPPWTGYL
jgi:hypothetical protein